MKETLKNSFLFRGVDEIVIDEIIKKSPPTAVDFKRGELVYPTEDEGLSVGFVKSGRLEIRRTRCDGGRVVLNILSESDSFGILSVYTDEDFPTQIFAAKNSGVLFFSKAQIEGFVNNYSQISQNLIHFLANRITFLNHKIATFSGNSVEEKLAAFLLSERARFCSGSFEFNRLKTAEEINSGRASVYRVLAHLEENGIISLDDKKINILDPNGLERIVK